MTGPTRGNERKAFVRDVFGSIVRRYDAANDVISLGLHRLWRRKTVRLLGLIEGRFLDLGAGTGCLTKMAFNRGHQGPAVLCDFSWPMLLEGRRQVSAGNASFVCGDGEELPFKREAFQGILLGFSLRNMPEIPTALREIWRVLSPGGRVAILEMSRPATFLEPIYTCYLKFIMPLLGGWVTGYRRSYEHLRDSTLAFPDRETLSGMMLAAGLKGVRFHSLLGGVAAIHVGEVG